MKTIAILSQKGGAGKTTIALNLAIAAEVKNIAAAVIDLDPQSSAAAWGDSREAVTPAVVSAQAARLEGIMNTCKENGAGMVVIDTAPHAEQSALAAARAADIVIIPCRPSIVDLRAISSTIDLARIAGTPAFIVLNQTPARGTLAEEATQAMTNMNIDVAPVQIGQRVAYVHAFTEGQGVLEYEPKGKAAQEIKTLYRFILKNMRTQNEQEKELSRRTA